MGPRNGCNQPLLSLSLHSPPPSLPSAADAPRVLPPAVATSVRDTARDAVEEEGAAWEAGAANGVAGVRGRAAAGVPAAADTSLATLLRPRSAMSPGAQPHEKPSARTDASVRSTRRVKPPAPMPASWCSGRTWAARLRPPPRRFAQHGLQLRHAGGHLLDVDAAVEDVGVDFCLRRVERGERGFQPLILQRRGVPWVRHDFRQRDAGRGVDLEDVVQEVARVGGQRPDVGL